MAEENNCDGLFKSRTVLGDLANRLRKREFSQREKIGIKSSNFHDKDTVKRVRVSARPCTEVNSLKGNVMSSISKIINENRNPNLSDFGSDFAVSKSSIDVETDLDGGHCLKATNVVMGNSKALGGSKDINGLDLSRGNADFQSVNELDVVEDDAFQRMDKPASNNHKDPKLKDLEGEEIAVNSISTKPGGCIKLDFSNENVILGISEVVTENEFANLKNTVRGNEVEELSNGKNDPNLTNLGKGNALQCANIDANDELGDGVPSDSFRTLSETGRDCFHDNKSSDGDDNNDYQNDLDDHNADNLFLSQSGSIDCTILPESQESRVFEVEKSTELKKGDELCANMSGGIDSIKACSCSFCTKAAYIWLDLNYQDIKARVSAMRKSQKEARILTERSYRSKAIQKHVAESSTKVSTLESDLTYQWRSLFQNMADIWEAESNQLEGRLVQLTDLKGKCKTDLRSINLTPSEKS